MNDNYLVIVDRRKWHRGKPQARLLKRDTGMMCCLGFACKQILGCHDDEIMGKSMPAAVEAAKDSVFISPTGVHSPWVSDAVALNDNEAMSDEVREKELKRVGAKAGVDFRFVH